VTVPRSTRRVRLRRVIALSAVSALLVAPARLGAQPKDTTTVARVPWYESFRIRGYGQVRYNRLLENNPDFRCEQCDRSWGTGGLFIRRARIILQGQIHPRVFMYLQPDFASSVGTTLNVAQLRDWYVDVGLDSLNEFRVRLGQSKIPYSFESMQSSSNRLPLDRADATNSAHVNERDLGVFLYWAPRHVRERYRRLVEDNLKGSGDYGALAIGVHNGQPPNRADANPSLHVVARATWPFDIGGRLVEGAVAGYTGRYVVTADQRSTGVQGHEGWEYRDERALVSLAIAPQPFGLLAEYNVGRGPEYDPQTDSIRTQSLRGGFVTAMWKLEHGEQVLFPFVRYQVYDGGKKHELDARSHVVRDLEVGVEWQPMPNFELVAEWYAGERRFEDRLRPDNLQRGRLLRLQAQFNY
jgi:hypothetical protein